MIYKIVIWTIVILSIISILFIYIILHIKRCIYDIFNEQIDIQFNENIEYPSDFDINKFNIPIYKYLIKLLLDFNKEINNNFIIYPNVGDEIFYINYNKKKLIKLIFDSNKNLWIVIRGTLTYTEFEHDLKISQCVINNKNEKCHCGFFEIYKKVKKHMFSIIEQLKPNYILCLGHSLGGGVITVAAKDLFETYNKVIIYTTGTPKVCDNYYKNSTSKYNLFKIENISDTYVNAIPSVLPFYNNTSYDKIGKVIYFDDNQNNITLNHKIEIYFLNINNYSILQKIN